MVEKECAYCCRNPTNTNFLEIGLLEIPENLYRAIEVMNGRYGTGSERSEKLKTIGVNPKEIQSVVNQIATYWDV